MNKFHEIEDIGNDLKLTGGDFNITLISKDKNIETPHPHVLSTNFIKSYMQAEDVVDSWRIFNPDEFRFSWMRHNPRFTAERLNYVHVNV